MELTTTSQPAQAVLIGWERLTLNNPGMLKIQTTGPVGSTLLHQGPLPGKVWTVQVRLDVTETDT